MKKIKNALPKFWRRALESVMTITCAFSAIFFAIPGMAATTDDVAADENVVDVESYDVESSVFQKIADLEQEKVLMQLEKDKAQLQLDLDRLAAEQTRLVREQENADARAEEQAAEIEKQKLAIEEERQKLDDQKKKMAEEAAKRAAAADKDEEAAAKPAQKKAEPAESAAAAAPSALVDRYFLFEIVGAGNQLVATVENLETGKQKKVSVGKTLDGYAVRSISIDDGIEFEKDGEVSVLGVGAFNASASGTDNE